MIYHIISYYIVLYCIMLCYVMLGYVMLYHVTLYWYTRLLYYGGTWGARREDMRAPRILDLPQSWCFFFFFLSLLSFRCFRGIDGPCTPCGGEVLHVCLKMSRAKPPDVRPCRSSPPMPLFLTRLARNAWCNTMSHLTSAGCSRGCFERLGPAQTRLRVLIW